MPGCGGWETVDPVCRAKQVLGGAVGTVGSDVFNSIAHHFADAATSAVSWLWKQLNTATSINLADHAVRTDVIATGAIAGVVTFALFLVQIIASTLRQDPGGLVRAVRGLAVSFIGAAFAVAVTQVILTAVDELANGVVQYALGTNVNGLGSRLIAANALGSIGNPAGLLLLSLVIIAAVVVIWVALMIRKMLIIISAVFAPIAFSGAASDISRSWVRRWIEFTVALVFSKLVLVIVFMIGLTVLNSADHPHVATVGGASTSAETSVTNLAVGALTLLLAGFAPWIAIKMVHFAGDSFHAVHAQAGTAAAGAQTVVAAPQKVTAVMPGKSIATPTSGAASNGNSSRAAAPLAQPKPDASSTVVGAPVVARAAAQAAAQPTSAPRTKPLVHAGTTPGEPQRRPEGS